MTKQKVKRKSMKSFPIYEHLEYHLKNTTYADRLQWLQEANDFVRMIERKRKKGTLFVS